MLLYSSTMNKFANGVVINLLKCWLADPLTCLIPHPSTESHPESHLKHPAPPAS
jgi:hypothetical protein